MQQSCVTRLSRTALFLALPAMLALSACDRSPTEPGNDHGAPVGMELLDRASGARLAWTEGTGGSIQWSGSIPALDVGSEIAVNARFADAEGRTIPLGGEYTVRAVLASGAAGGVVAISNHGDHVDLGGLAAGETRLIFQLYHGNHSDWDSPSIRVTVQAPTG